MPSAHARVEIHGELIEIAWPKSKDLYFYTGITRHPLEDLASFLVPAKPGEIIEIFVVMRTIKEP